MNKDFFKKVEEWICSPAVINLRLGSKEALENLSETFNVTPKSIRSSVYMVWRPDIPWTVMMAKDIDNHPLNYTVISRFDGKPFVLRGYPRAKKINNPSFKNKVIIQPSYDGIHLEFFKLPNGMTHSKTRQLEYTDRDSLYNRNLKEDIDKLPFLDKIENFLSENPDLVIVGELFGKSKNLAGITDYDEEVNYRAFDVLNRKEYSYLKWEESRKLLSNYEIPVAEDLNEEDISLSLQKHGGIIFKSYTDGNVEIYKKFSDDFLNIKNESDSLNGKKIRVCLRETLDNT